MLKLFLCAYYYYVSTGLPITQGGEREVCLGGGWSGRDARNPGGHEDLWLKNPVFTCTWEEKNVEVMKCSDFQHELAGNVWLYQGF